MRPRFSSLATLRICMNVKAASLLFVAMQIVEANAEPQAHNSTHTVSGGTNAIAQPAVVWKLCEHAYGICCLFQAPSQYCSTGQMQFTISSLDLNATAKYLWTGDDATSGTVSLRNGLGSMSWTETGSGFCGTRYVHVSFELTTVSDTSEALQFAASNDTIVPRNRSNGTNYNLEPSSIVPFQTAPDGLQYTLCVDGTDSCCTTNGYDTNGCVVYGVQGNDVHLWPDDCNGGYFNAAAMNGCINYSYDRFTGKVSILGPSSIASSGDNYTDVYGWITYGGSGFCGASDNGVAHSFRVCGSTNGECQF